MEERKDLEREIGIILRIGVLLSVIVMILGFSLYLLSGAHTGFKYNTWPTNFGTIVLSSLRLKPGALMMLGLFLLILTPILRVIASIISFARIKDWQYVIITSIVLFILIIAISIGALI
ncbi:DUF1634 domain-containing protein [Leuconostoc fallax]|uniref:DUF1634 domain-containing protein n=1 Tax=Leuconostoc fallax TaxID=1251 RepID=A0A4R5NAL1_9LACO|nr:DUF1634 domain-containing protein [Leuconostoc fallax]MBU7454988.1 DUF1634 domain-containing protein [Leuconostoc fallax]MCO6183264.1 DUF1634 domain-containing protein [Leuconostoc fallax]TDG69553.1 hypothetical protein C5L23_001015 [Leuconostoc fallax]